MADVIEILKTTMRSYAGNALNGRSVFTQSEDETTFAVTGIGQASRLRVANLALLVTLTDDGAIVIERDATNRPLVDALVQAGVPREKIVLAYAGEKLPGTQPADAR